MACDPINASKVTQKVFDCLRKKLAKHKINIPKGKNRGKVKTDDYEIEYAWDPGSKRLKVRVLDKPSVFCAR